MGSVEIRRYDERWPDEFREAALRLRGDLGALATRIDHIGSTSVRGLSSKDVIDVQVTVPGDPDLGRAAAILETRGWDRSPRIDRDLGLPAGTRISRTGGRSSSTSLRACAG